MCIRDSPKVFAYSAGPDEAFALFCGIAKYDIRKSIFYTEQRRENIADCFFYVLERFRALFAGKARRFEDYIFHPVTRPALFKPFASEMCIRDRSYPLLRCGRSKRPSW